MKKTSTIILSAAALFALNGCGNDTPSSPDPKTYSKAPQAVYETACASCHGAKGEGSDKVAAINTKQSGELELDLYDVKNGVIAPDVAEHNMKGLAAKGLDYDPKAMADFMDKTFFNTDALKTPPAPEPAPEPAPAEPAASPEATPAPAEAPAAENAPAAEPAAPAEPAVPATETPATPEPVKAPEATTEVPAPVEAPTPVDAPAPAN